MEQTKYDTKYDEIAYSVCKEFGATDAKLAEVFSVSTKTINNWKNAHPTFARMVREGKDSFDSEHVESKLLQRALGFEYDEQYVTKDGEVRTVTKSLPPDNTAIIFYLKNRNPERWRDVRNVQLDMGKELTRNVFVVPGIEDFDHAVEQAKEDFSNDLN